MIPPAVMLAGRPVMLEMEVVSESGPSKPVMSPETVKLAGLPMGPVPSRLATVCREKVVVKWVSVTAKGPLPAGAVLLGTMEKSPMLVGVLLPVPEPPGLTVKKVRGLVVVMVVVDG